MPLCLCSLLAATSQFRVSIGQKMQLTGKENANNMRNAKCAGTQNSMEWLYCSFLYCGLDHTPLFRISQKYDIVAGISKKSVVFIVRFSPSDRCELMD